jgi:hypothetical protein
MDYPQHPFHNSTIRVGGGTSSIGNIKISTADRQKCPICGHKTGDCTGDSAPPKHIAGFNQIESLKATQSLLVEEDIYEEPPSVGNRLAFIYRDDGKGNGSSNTGFFLRFTQGILNQGSFTLTQPSTDETVDLDAVNINNNDVWLYRLDNNGLESEYWAKVPSFEGNNVIYNSLTKSIRNIYGIVTRASDRISLVYRDGVCGNLPQRAFRV